MGVETSRAPDVIYRAPGEVVDATRVNSPFPPTHTPLAFSTQEGGGLITLTADSKSACCESTISCSLRSCFGISDAKRHLLTDVNCHLLALPRSIWDHQSSVVVSLCVVEFLPLSFYAQHRFTEAELRETLKQSYLMAPVILVAKVFGFWAWSVGLRV